MLRVQHFAVWGEAVGVFHFWVHTSLEVIVGVLVGSISRTTIIREVLNWPLSERKPPDVVPLKKAQTGTSQLSHCGIHIRI